MSELNEDKLAVMIRELDDMVPREGAAVRMDNDPADGEGFITANRLGFLRFGIEMLKAGVKSEPTASAATADIPDADLSYIFETAPDLTAEELEAVEEQQKVIAEAQPQASTTGISSGMVAMFIAGLVALTVFIILAHMLGWFQMWAEASYEGG